MTSPDVAATDSTATGDPAQLIFERFTRRLIGLARTHLDARLRHKVDPEDVVQSAYKSFFLRYGEGALAAEGWAGLWGLLTTITLRKCADRARYHNAERRDLNREAATGDGPWMAALDREPTPEQAVSLAETLAAVLDGLGEAERPIVELSLQGYSTQEVADRLNRAERSVRRVRERVRLQLERMRAESE